MEIVMDKSRPLCCIYKRQLSASCPTLDELSWKVIIKGSVKIKKKIINNVLAFDCYCISFIQMCLILSWKCCNRYLECKYFKNDYWNILPYFLIDIYCAPVMFKVLLQVLFIIYLTEKKSLFYFFWFCQLSVHYDHVKL